jgi:DNA primase
MINQETVNKIFDTADIIEVIQDFVNLKKRGANYLGLCPFHNEKTPSFSVSPSKQIYKCFGCGKGGNAVNFIMDHEQLSYAESLKYLANKYNIEIVEKELTADQIRERNEVESLLIVTAFAQKYFTNNLYETEEGRAIGLTYFKERGFRDQTIQKFQLGYSLEKRNAFALEAEKQGYKKDFLVKTGLTIEKGDAKYDRFSGRVMFPIYSLSGKVIGFGGRILKKDEKTAKYLNSPESPVYHKSKVLYGLYQAKGALVKEDKCFMVEGYTDVLSLHQLGIENVVASSGTSLTVDQIRLIKRFTPNITVIYDGDEAGTKASLRGIDLILEQGLNVKVVLLPQGEDPDSFAKQKSASEYLDFIANNEKDFIKFKARLLMEEAQNDPVKEANLISDIVKSISVIPEGITRSVYLKECSSLLAVDEKLLYSEVNKKRRKEFDKKRKHNTSTAPKPAYQTEKKAYFDNLHNKNLEYIEKEIIRLLLKYGGDECFKEQFTDEDGLEYEVKFTVAQYIIRELYEKDQIELEHPQCKAIFYEYRNSLESEAHIDTKYFINHPDQLISQLTIEVLTSKYALSNIWKKNESYVETEDMKIHKVVYQTILAYKHKKILIAIENIHKRLKEAQQNNQMDDISELQRQIIHFNTMKQQLSKELGERIIL